MKGNNMDDEEIEYTDEFIEKVAGKVYEKASARVVEHIEAFEEKIEYEVDRRQELQGLQVENLRLANEHLKTLHRHDMIGRVYAAIVNKQRSAWQNTERERLQKLAISLADELLGFSQEP